MKRTLPIIFCLILLALVACEGATGQTQVPLPTVIFVQSGSPTPLLPPPSPALTLTAQSPVGPAEPVEAPMPALPSPTASLTLIPTYTPTATPTVTPPPTDTPTPVPADTPTPLPPTPAPTATSTPMMCNIKVTNNIPCSITLAVAGTEFDFEAGGERVIEITPGTYSYVISGPCIMDLRDKGEFPAGYWSWSPTIEYP
ncbi:MAG TPA: hypothetical protein EYP49_19405 [Anaerolineae bacterium]|nr:hypothetical protein [Anaerolineae bacterium]